MADSVKVTVEIRGQQRVFVIPDAKAVLKDRQSGLVAAVGLGVLNLNLAILLALVALEDPRVDAVLDAFAVKLSDSEGSQVLPTKPEPG